MKMELFIFLKGFSRYPAIQSTLLIQLIHFYCKGFVVALQRTGPAAYNQRLFAMFGLKHSIMT